jgi:hypothetical protein
MNNLLNPARAENETFEDYKARRMSAKVFVQSKLTTLVWDSLMKGTYLNSLRARAGKAAKKAAKKRGRNNG